MKRISLDLSRLSDFPIVAPDCETTGLHWYRDEAFSIAIAAYDPKSDVMASGYWDFRDEGHEFVDKLKREFAKCKLIVNHNIKFDAHFLLNKGIALSADRVECTSIRAALINEHEPSFGLDALGQKYIGMGKETGVYQELATIFGGKPTKDVQMKNLHRAPKSLAKKYAILDPQIAILLWLWQEKEIEKQNLEQVWGLERQVMPVIFDMERQGVRVDVDRAVSSQAEIDKIIGKTQKSLNKEAGRVVNANSPPQMRELFKAEQSSEDKRWRACGVLLETTDGGQPSMNADALRALAGRGNPLAKMVMTLRKMTKAKSFLKDHILGHEINGLVYPNYNQTRGDNEMGTGTGRFSVDDPALQQIPARDKEIASIVRACFIPDNGHQWCCGDWEQFEFRWFAHYADDRRLSDIYAKNPSADYHQMVADLTGLPRSARYAGDANAKQINLGLVFGMGQGKMAMEMGLDYTVRRDDNGREWLVPGAKAVEVFERYHSAIPGVKQLLDRASSIARSRGYVRTAMGRHIRFPGGKFTHKAGGLVFQGSSADSIKVKMVEMAPIAKREGFKMLLSVHDELDFSVPAKLTKKHGALIKNALERFDGEGCPIKCDIPILSSVSFGPNWYEASK